MILTSILSRGIDRTINLHQLCWPALQRRIFLIVIGFAVALATSPASALITSKTPSGLNHDRAHAAPHVSLGTAVPVGVIEINGGVNPAKTSIDEDGRLIKNLNFIGVATPVGAEPPAVGATVSDHATQVTDIIGASNGIYTGVANKANMYVGAVRSDAEIFAAPVWYNNNGKAGIFNYSLGGPTFGFESLRDHTEVQVFLTNAGDSTNITTNPFTFTAANFQSIDQLEYSFILKDADNGAGEFDLNNLQLNIGGVIIGPLNSNIATDNLLIQFTNTRNLTPAQSQALMTVLTNNAGNVHIQLQKIANGAPNEITPTNIPAGANERAELILRQFNDNGNNKLTRALDWFATATDSLNVVSAGNDGRNSRQIESPADQWNGITVGAMNGNFTARADFSSYLQSSGKNKPEVMAPGENIWTEFIPGSNGAGNGTSFAAPHVTGIAALLEAGTENTAGLVLGLANANQRHLATKAVILNSARKRFAVAPENTVNTDITDNALTNAETGDGDYMNGPLLRVGSTNIAPKTPSWTPSDWSYNANANLFTAYDPLDDELGTGIADAERALIQLDGGKQVPGNITPIGWDLNTVTGVSFKEYTLNFAVTIGQFFTSTLDWDRPITRVDNGDGVVGFNDTFNIGALADLDLALLYKGSTFAQSISTGGVVEHLHVPFMQNGAAGDYTLRVYGWNNAITTPYGLAWWTGMPAAVPEPGSFALLVIGVAFLTARRSRISMSSSADCR